MGIYRLSDRLVRLETARPGATEDTIAHRLHPSATCRAAKIAILLAYIAPLSVFGAARDGSPMHLPSYKAVPVYYEPLNKMIMPVRINGQPAPDRCAQSELAAENRQLSSRRPNIFCRRRCRPHRWTHRTSRIAENPGLQGRATLTQVISPQNQEREVRNQTRNSS